MSSRYSNLSQGRIFLNTSRVCQSTITGREPGIRLSSNWPFRKSGFTTDSADQVDIAHLDAAYRFQQRDIYLYWMSFHPDGCSLLFVDQDLNGPSTAAILTIESHSGLVTSLLKQFPINSHRSLLLHPEWSRGFNQVKVIYNPVLPLLGFSFAGMFIFGPTNKVSY